MHIQRLLSSFKILKCGALSGRLLSTESSVGPSKLIPGLNALFINNHASTSIKNDCISTIRLSPRSVVNISNEVGRIKPSILDIPFFPIPQNIPVNDRISILDMPLDDNKILECPAVEDVQEKQAIRMIVIRRRKMRKHKLRKLRKRMKFEWAKRRQRRELKKEKAFQAILIARIQEAEKFSAEEYVTQKLKLANEEPIPRYWKGKALPRFLIRQLMGLDKKINYKNIPNTN